MKKLILTAILALGATVSQAEPVNHIELIENYLNSTKTFKADFDQFAAGEDVSKGTFYLKRPGKFLWQYKTPADDKILSNGGAVYYVEEDNGEVTQIPANHALTGLFTKAEIDLGDPQIRVISIKDNEGFFATEFQVLEEGETVGSAVLGFKKDPVQLNSLTTIDPTGARVHIRFYNVEESQPISNNLFAVETPFDL